MFLEATHKLEIDLGGAADPNPQVTACWKDVDNNDKVTRRAASTVVADTTDVTIIDAAGSQTGDGEVQEREVDLVAIYNADNAPVTFNLWINDGTNTRTIYKATLATLEMAVFTPASGWKCYDVNGAVKMV